MRRLGPSPFWALLSLGFGCVDAFDPASATFACTTSAECSSGWTCGQTGQCVSSEALVEDASAVDGISPQDVADAALSIELPDTHPLDLNIDIEPPDVRPEADTLSPARCPSTGTDQCNSPGPWEGVSRELVSVGFGQVVAIGCQPCFEDANPELAATLLVLEDALGRGADLVSLSVALVGDDLFVQGLDGSAGLGPALSEVLSSDVLSQTDALVYLRLVESEPTPAFAGALVASVGESGLIAPGRPVLIEAAVEQRGVIADLKSAMATAGRPEWQLLYGVAYPLLKDGSLGPARAENVAQLPGQGIRFARLEFKDEALAAVLPLAESSGVTLGVGPGVGDFSENLGAALRPQVDILWASDVEPFLATVPSPDSILWIDAGAIGAAATTIDAQTPFGSVALPIGGVGQPGVGADASTGWALSFDAVKSQALVLPEVGFNGVVRLAITVTVKVDVSPAPGVRAAFLALDDGAKGGITFGLTGSQLGPLLGARVDGEAGSVTTEGGPTEFELGHWHVVTLLYDGTQGLNLSVDGQIVGFNPKLTGSLTSSAAPAIIGAAADPGRAPPAGLSAFLTGQIRSVHIQRSSQAGE